jgi:hypothetical protein
MNKTFQKAVYLLSRPVSLVALVLLFLNDHVLRVLWPSWITGKLGDFAWLYFAPFALAALLAMVVPASVRNHEKLVGLLAFGIVGGAFFLGNSFVATHGFVLAVVDGLLPFPVQIIRDPLDLVALVVMVPAWRMWMNEAPQPVIGPARGVVLVSVAACLTIANAPAPDTGIDCVCVGETEINAYSSYEYYSSQDGGKSWQAGSYACHCSDWSEDGVVTHPDDENILFRRVNRKRFEMSEDKGQTWQALPRFRPASEAAIAFHSADASEYLYGPPVPRQVVQDPETGNLVFSMGHEGVVVMTPEGEWQRVTVGDYGLEAYNILFMPILLIGEIILAFEAALIVLGMLYQIKMRKFIRAALYLLVWLLWGFIAVAGKPAWASSYGLTVLYAGLIVVGFISGIALAYVEACLEKMHLGKLRTTLRKIALGCGGVFLLPYVLWGFDIIHQYETAMIAGLVLGGLAIIAGIVWMLKIPIVLKELEVDEPAPEEAE